MGFVVRPLLLGAVLGIGRHVAGARGGGAAALGPGVALATTGWRARTRRAAAGGLLWRFGMRPPPFAVLVAAVAAWAGHLRVFRKLGEEGRR
jgi:hypothetical protein